MPSPFEPIRVGSIEILNRIAMAPIKTAYGTTSGEVTDRLVAYFRRRAEGGVGLIISEPLYVDKRGAEHPKQLGIDTDNKVEGLQRLADAIHAAGAKVFAHINHAGRAANPKAAGKLPEAPSNISCSATGVESEVLSERRIRDLIQAFADAGLRAKQAGFDGVELQFGLGYLVAQFLSSATNLRNDAYGGDPEKRVLFGRQVFEAVRKAVGDEFPIGIRISGSEKTPRGLDIDDAKGLARRLESWGANLIHVATGCSCESPPWYFQHMVLPAGVNEAIAAKVRKAVQVPVMVAGRLGDPSRVREVLEKRLVDMVALGRPLVADPDFPGKMLESRDDEVLLCGNCLQGCLANVKAGKGIGCNINPEVGHELEEPKPPSLPARIVVVGGGPAGIQAALTAYRRGHHVTLFETNRMGGQFALAFLAPGKHQMEKPLRSLLAQVYQSTIEVRLGEEATTEKIEGLDPDAVIVATGARPVVPDIPGVDELLTAEDVLTESRDAREAVLVLGGGMVGVEVAEFLAARGKQVAIVEMLEDIAHDMDPISRKLMLSRLSTLPVELHPMTELVRMEDGRAIITKQGVRHELGPFKSVVAATGMRSLDGLSEELRRTGVTVKIVGDAQRPRKIYDAVRSGHRAALTI